MTISRWSPALAALALSLFHPGAAVGQNPALASPRRNVVVILADDIGAKELGCYGNARHKTPNLDKFASEGVRFETCYVEPLCTPTRVALMTGRYGFRTGYFHMSGRPLTPKPGTPEHEIGDKFTIADLVKTKGYATALSGKWQLPGKIPTLIHDCGFDTYRMWAYAQNLPEGAVHTGGFEGAGRTSRYWHPSIVQDGKYLPTKPDDYGPDLFTDFVISFAKAQSEKKQNYLAYFTMPLTHGPHVETPDPMNPGRRLSSGFATNVEYLDHLMGRLVRSLDEIGARDDTLIVFIGDNGTAGSGKGTLTELGVRVPLMIRGPGVRAGVVSRELTDLTDIFATVADFTGTKAPEGLVLDGTSLMPTLRGEPGLTRDWVFSFLGHGRILRDRRWLLELPGDGTERFFDCGESRDGKGYREVSPDASSEAKAARERFALILKDHPGPEGHPNLIPEPATPAAGEAATKKAARKKAAAKKKAAVKNP